MFRNFRGIAAVNNDGLMLALLTISPDVIDGIALFDAFPWALIDSAQPLPKPLVHRVKEFGLHRLLLLRSKEFPMLRLRYREPRHDFDSSDKPPKGVGITQLRKGSFELEGEEWTVFETEEERPYPGSNPGRKDTTFYCIPVRLYEK